MKPTADKKAVLVKKKDIVVSPEVYWKLVARKFDGNYRSIDEALRKLLKISPGPRPHLKKH